MLLLVRLRLYAALSSWWERMEGCVLTVLTPPVFSNCTNLAVKERPAPVAVWLVAAIEFF